MDKTQIEIIINKRAQRRYDEQLEQARDFIERHPILRKMRLSVDEDGNYVLRGCTLLSLLDSKQMTNIKDIEKELVENYEKVEMEDILDKLKAVKYLFDADNAQ